VTTQLSGAVALAFHPERSPARTAAGRRDRCAFARCTVASEKYSSSGDAATAGVVTVSTFAANAPCAIRRRREHEPRPCGRRRVRRHRARHQQVRPRARGERDERARSERNVARAGRAVAVEVAHEQEARRIEAVPRCVREVDAKVERVVAEVRQPVGEREIECRGDGRGMRVDEPQRLERLDDRAHGIRALRKGGARGERPDSGRRVQDRGARDRSGERIGRENGRSGPEQPCNEQGAEAADSRVRVPRCVHA
jgi:hypothetical protein